MTDNPNPESKNASRSLTLRGAVSMAIAFAISRLGVELPEGAPQAIAESVMQLVFYAGLIAVGVGRARARGPLS